MRRVRTPDVEQVWRRRIDAWHQSGLSQKAFCERNNLALSTFSLWRHRLSKPAKQTNPVSACIEIVPVARVQAMVVPTPPVVVVVGGRYRVELAEGFQRETLLDVLQVLEARV